jgi:opacity protein-like surface antigen
MNLRRQTVGIGGLALVAILISASAWAADADHTIEEIEEVIETNFDEDIIFDWRTSPWIRFRLGANFIPDADFGSVDVTSTRVAGAVKMLIPVSERLAFRGVIRSGAAFYDFDGDKRFLDSGRTSGDPFDDLIETAISVGGRYQVNDAWSAIGRTYLTSRHEDDASFGSGIEGGGMVGASFDWRDRVSVIGGVGLGTRMAEGGVRVLPVFQLKWKITDRFKLVIDGFQGRVTARINEALRLSVTGGVEGKRYRLEDRGGAIGKGTIRDRRAIVGFRGDWRMNSRWRIRTELGSVIDQELKIEDSDGDNVDESHSDGLAFYGSLSIEYRFGR